MTPREQVSSLLLQALRAALSHALTDGAVIRTRFEADYATSGRQAPVYKQTPVEKALELVQEALNDETTTLALVGQFVGEITDGLGQGGPDLELLVDSRYTVADYDLCTDNVFRTYLVLQFP